ncbi:MAG: modification methylase [Methanomicrobiales archaeon HGW-Methanomicrobiales-3]|jgi:DNA adenine methylase|nr:MAG: modification methylase [Methanomicrobiales archaeon HGW-Methanomicrobiales-3]
MAKQTDPVPAARPFLKWAGGKTQLLDELEKRLPEEIRTGKITRYVEPFIGGGAVFFYLNRHFSFEHCDICDVNKELILSYRVIQNSVQELIAELENLKSAYFSRAGDMQEQMYYEVRNDFNLNLTRIDFDEYNDAWIERTAQIIFLNRTCFNGLFRVNRRGEFNVPFGGYKKPDILNQENLHTVSALLKKTRIHLGDFTTCQEQVNDRTFVYFDPPYRPLKRSSSFTSYSKDGFSDADQVRLAGFFRKLDGSGAKVMLSNSDPKNEKPQDTFFDSLYAGYYVGRVPARRRINCKGTCRGDISELVITNYPQPDE